MLLGINSTRKAIEIALLVPLIPNITFTCAIIHTNNNIIATKTIIIVKMTITIAIIIIINNIASGPPTLIQGLL